MRQLFSVSALAIVSMLFVLGGCEDRHEAAIKKTISSMNDLGTVLKTVKDEASSKAAAKKVAVIVQSMQEQKKKMESAEKPSDEKEKAMRDKYEKQLDEAMKVVFSEGMRVSTDPKLMTPELQAALEGMKNIE